MNEATPALSRRRLFEIIGASVGGAAVYQAMTRLGYAEESPYRGPIKLDGDPKGASVSVLGAGLAGMTAAIELERAGYKVSVLEYNLSPGRRNWSLRGGDVYTELGGATQKCEFDAGLYLNPGPWRIPYHHYAILDYCRRFGGALAPFIRPRNSAERRKSASSMPASISIPGHGAFRITITPSWTIAAASGARSRPSSDLGTRRSDAKVRVRCRPLSQSRAMAHSVSPLRHPGLLPPLRGRARALHPTSELGGATQKCEFDAGLYLNPGPWRIPYHHYAILDYCRRFGVALEPFIQLNHNAYLHSANAFGGKPQRIRDIKADFDGGVAELLAKATKKGALDDSVSTEDREILLEALRSLGALGKDFRYRAGEDSAAHRGYAKHSGGGLGAAPITGDPLGLHDILT